MIWRRADNAEIRGAKNENAERYHDREVHGKRMIEDSFNPGGKVTTQRKDLAQALKLAKQLGVELPATALNLRLYACLIERGWGELDHSALIKVLEKN